ncbi:M20/M25/M40 family metallo-hydrolase [Gemmatimonas sp.]|uniref:M20/M25/M40 family metallo-hydrolase n=1 Tax=Gemmatimonas sp. TaxID=1962908 RepID=UPI00333EAA2E
MNDAVMAMLCARVRAQQAWTLHQQLTLAAIAAPTGNESTRARRVQRLLQQCGAAPVTRHESGNVECAVGPGDTPPLVCMAHLDSVYATPPQLDAPIAVQRDGALVHAPGIGDNGRGLAGLLTLAAILQAPDVLPLLTRRVHLVATVGEEGDGNLRGARAWFDDSANVGVIPVAAIAIDGPGDASIVHQAAGAHRMRVEVRGSGGHSWVHATAHNPIHALGDFIARASRLGNAQRRDVVVHITRMGGGESLTAIPQHAWVEVDIRGTSATRIASVRQQLVRLAHDVTPASLRVTVTVLGDRPAGALAGDHPLVQLAQRATEAVGVTPRAAVASTDANIPLSRGIPAICLGAGGDGGGAHTDGEWYDDAHGPRGLERLMRVVMALAS